MPRSKKRKTTHHPQSQNQSGLSHEEIWDDSALLRSWNDALAEYEFYHSIHAKGEDVEEVLRRAEMDVDETAEANGDVDVETQIRNGIENDNNDDEDEGEIVEEIAEQDDVGIAGSEGPLGPVPETIVNPEVSADDIKATTSTSTTTVTPDQLLEKIKMSYYWAGYYSGLYDAQRQSQVQSQAENDV